MYCQYVKLKIFCTIVDDQLRQQQAIHLYHVVHFIDQNKNMLGLDITYFRFIKHLKIVHLLVFKTKNMINNMTLKNIHTILKLSSITV